MFCLALAGWAATGLGGAAWAARSHSLLLFGLGLTGLVLGRYAGLRRDTNRPGTTHR